MILQALSEYYQRKAQEGSNELAPPGFEKKEIPFIIVLDGEGRFVDLEDTRAGEGKKKTGRIFLVPQGEKRSGKNSWQIAFLLWDHLGYVLGYSANDKERARRQQQSFLAKIESIFPDLAIDIGIGAVKEFLRKGDFSRIYKHPLWQEIKDLNPNVSFRLANDDQLVCQREAVRRKIAEQAAADRQQLQRCLLSGERDAIARLHPPIKGVWGAQTSGANIISFNLDPFNSYSKIQGLNAPLGERAVFAYTTALNHLLRKGSRQRIQVGDASTVFWAAKDHPSEEQFIAWLDPDSDDPDQGVEAVRALYAAPQSGAKPLNEDSTPFYVLGLAPNAARIAIRFWYQGTVGELAQHIRQHFDDIRIAHAPYELEFLSLFRLLIATALQNKSENIPPNLAGDFMKAILAGTPYPRTLLAATLRRVRAEQAKKYERPFDIYVKEKAVLGRSHLEAFKNLGIQLGEEGKHPVPEKLKEKMEEVALPEGLSLVENQDEQLDLIVAAGIDKKEIKDWLEKAELDKEIEKFINSAIKNSKSRKPTGEETQQGREKMCEWFFDIRTFGAVMSLKSVPNCGQVRGPVQMSFARSVSPVVPLEHSITRMAVATEAESEKQSGDNRTMGRKFTIPYGLYRGYGYISAHLARQTGFSEDDLALLWEALINMFEHDHSAARGQMSVRGLYVFKHDNALGHAPAHVLFDCITVQPREGVSVPREFSDYQVIVNDTKLSQGVTLMRQVG